MTDAIASAVLPIALSPQDRLVINGGNWSCSLLTQHGYSLVNEENNEFTHTLSFEALRAALTQRKAQILWGYYSAGQVKLRQLLGGDRRDGFKDTDVIVARFKEQLILCYETALRKRGKLRVHDLAQVLEHWAAYANHRLNGRLAKPNPQFFFKSPSVRVFLRDYATYLECGRDPRSLLPRPRGPRRTPAAAEHGNT